MLESRTCDFKYAQSGKVPMDMVTRSIPRWILAVVSLGSEDVATCELNTLGKISDFHLIFPTQILFCLYFHYCRVIPLIQAWPRFKVFTWQHLYDIEREKVIVERYKLIFCKKYLDSVTLILLLYSFIGGNSIILVLLAWILFLGVSISPQK